MNVYDFDKTIYPGDSTFHFWIWCVSHYPAAILELPKTAITAILWAAGKRTQQDLKERFLYFLKHVPNPQKEAKRFWNKNITRIYPWYLKQKESNDVIISASPFFLVNEACKHLGIECIATDVDPETGHIQGANCRGTEKVLRYEKRFPLEIVHSFYSDSLSDLPMLQKANHAFLMKHGKIKKEWILEKPQ